MSEQTTTVRSVEIGAARAGARHRLTAVEAAEGCPLLPLGSGLTPSDWRALHGRRADWRRVSGVEEVAAVVRLQSETPLGSLRVDAGLTQAQVAARIGVVDRTVSRWERGVLTLTPARVEQLAAVYGVPPSVVFAAVTASRMEATG